MKRCLAALFIALVAFPSAARSDPPDNVRHHWAPVARPDAPYIPPYVPSHIPARGTDVAAPDQQASQPGPSLVSDRGDDGFEWSDAGIGALAGTALAGFAVAGAVGLRRRSAAPLGR